MISGLTFTSSVLSAVCLSRCVPDVAVLASYLRMPMTYCRLLWAEMPRYDRPAVSFRATMRHCTIVWHLIRSKSHVNQRGKPWMQPFRDFFASVRFVLMNYALESFSFRTLKQQGWLSAIFFSQFRVQPVGLSAELDLSCDSRQEDAGSIRGAKKQYLSVCLYFSEAQRSYNVHTVAEYFLTQ